MAYFPRDLDEYFTPLSATLNSFVERRGLLLEKYYHESPSWSLCFGHPKGGQAKIDVSAESNEQVCVQAVWWVDDYATFRRSLLWGEKRYQARQPEEVAVAVDRAFSETLSWEVGTWTQVAEGYQPYWSAFTAESFAKFANPWPKPRSERDA
jgi:hypothetical protein